MTKKGAFGILTLMEKRYEQTMLFDFYGELLTERQKEIYESVVMNDCSPSEAARVYEISRQGVSDMIRRIDRLLAGYEERLHLLDRFLSIRREIRKIEALTEDPKIRKLTASILEEL